MGSDRWLKIQHPEKGKIFDLSDDLPNQTAVEDLYCKVYPVDGYGNPDVVRELIELEKPDYYDLYRPKILGLVVRYGTRT